MELIPEIAEWIAKDLAQKIEKISAEHKSLASFLKSCESPMEQKFLTALFDTFPGFPCNWKGEHILCSDFCEPHALGFNLRIYPQRDIKIDVYDVEKQRDYRKYRADFLLKLTRWNHESGQTDIIEELVVEVDGHAYHEKTKAQAKRDRSRDRTMTASGLTIFRFTGSELFNQMDDSVMEIYTYLVNKVAHYSEMNGLKFY
ncbi:MAG: endonuclease domain-containing protein [Kangiellaceae bacterium]|nr:endonuclease domain-containing protein [Kangiellaceae bacterium]